ncbi:hypothetical protein GCM10027406_00230 [Leifsonia lichenia]
MGMITPADLSLELSMSQKRVRSVLRDLYGVLPVGTSRWEIDDAQADTVRARLEGRHREAKVWTLEPGDTVRRRSIHAAYGGQQQGGICTPRSVPDIIIFTDPASGARYGYDQFEGLREDGSYAYTGEGQTGPQEFVRGNRALRDSAAAGKTIRLLRTNGVFATYVGSFALDSPAYQFETIPDRDGAPRQGIIFNLIPVEARVDLLPAYGGGEVDSEESPIDYVAFPRVWSPPDYSDVVVAVLGEQTGAGERTVSRVEFQLQSDFGSWLVAEGTPPQRLPLRVRNITIEPDLYVPDRRWIVEAKRSIARGHVRTAIGQVLDYVHIARNAGLEARPVILLPGTPEPDLAELIANLGITLVVRSDDAFEVVAPS